MLQYYSSQMYLHMYMNYINWEVGITMLNMTSFGSIAIQMSTKAMSQLAVNVL